MNRDFKFRAWISSKKEMSYKICVGNTKTDNPCSIIWNENKKDWVNFDKSCGNVMQYTGKTDSNGKEIFEHDILEIDEFYDGDLKIINCKVVVYFIDGEFCVFRKESNINGFISEYISSLHTIIINTNVKIIGNIYENPELLV